MDLFALETCFPRFKVLSFILYYILTLQFLLFYFALCVVLDVASLQFVGRLISVFFTFNLFTLHFIFVLDVAALQLVVAQNWCFF